MWKDAFIAALVLSAAVALYIHFRWQRAPQAYRAMVAIALGCLAAGVMLGASIEHFTVPAPAVDPIVQTAVITPAAAPAAAHTISATVTEITDGDTVNAKLPDGFEHAIRLAGIDAPESAQAFGTQSTAHLSNLISGKAVTLQCSGDRSYGRMICKILLPDGEDVCLDMVKAGMAWHYKQYQDEQSATDRQAYAATECAAMKARIGLWSDPHPVQPQDFRHGTNSPLLLDSNGCRTSSEPTTGPVVGNERSHIFEWPQCPYYASISPDNRVPFTSPQAAEAAGYRPAHNCP
jgi:endonuclease YncB( thermonuclease family)